MASLAVPSLTAQDTADTSSATQYNGLLTEGRDAAMHGAVTQAFAVLSEAMRLRPEDMQARFEAGVLLAGMGEIREAEPLFRRCIELDPASAKAHYMLGLTLIADPATRLDWPEALPQFQAALRLQPVYPEASARLAQGLIAEGDMSAAIDELRRAVEHTPTSSLLQTQLGKALEAAQDIPLATQAYRRAIALNPHDTDASVALGKLLIAAGRSTEAAAILRTALRFDPDVQTAQYTLGRALRQLGKTKEAEAAVAASAQLAQRDPDTAAAKRLSNAALRSAADGRFAEATDQLQQALRLRPDYGIAHYNLGLILADQHRLLDAQYQLIQAVSLMPGRDKPLVDLSRVEQLLGNTAAADRERRWALQLNPALHARSAAASPIDRSVMLSNTSPTPLPPAWSDTIAAHQQLAVDLAAVGDHLGAAGQLLRAEALGPARADLRLALAREWSAMGQEARAQVEEHNAQLLETTSASP